MNTTTRAVRVVDETIAVVAVGLASDRLISDGERGGVADLLATLNRRHVAREYPLIGRDGTVTVPAPVVGYAWRWRPLPSALEVLTRLDFLLANMGADTPMALVEDLTRLRERTIRRLPGYGDPMWAR